MRSFPIGSMAVVGVCAVVDADATLTLMSAADTIKYCGTAGALGLLKMIALTGFGIISISIALVAVGAAFLIPELRNPRWWLWSVAALSLFAVADVAEAHARFPTPSNPAFCDF